MTGTSTEEWRPVAEPGFEELYEVSSQGRVRSLPRTIQASNRKVTYPLRVLKQNLDSQCYPQVVLCRETRRKTKSVHRLMAEAFLGPVPEGRYVLHKNGIPHDCRLDNLRYGTQSENVLEAIEFGSHNRAPEYTPIDWKCRRAEAQAELSDRLATLERSF